MMQLSVFKINTLRSALSALCLAALISLSAEAQNKGLRSPQPDSLLPESRAKTVMPSPNLKFARRPGLLRTQPNEWIISEGWEMSAAALTGASGPEITDPGFNTEKWILATVPGTVLTTLVNQGYYPDPLFGLNNLAIPDSLSRTDWWYRILLPLPEGSDGKTISLLFNGINYKAEIWLNGSMLGTIKGAFIRGRFDITKYLRETGKNVLAVHIFPPDHPGIPHEETLTETGPNGGILCYDGPTFICTEAWDWIPGIRDRNTGIWQDVRLIAGADGRIADPQVITDLPLPDTSSVLVTVKTGITNTGTSEKVFRITGEIGTTQFTVKDTLKPGEYRKIEFTPEKFPQLKILNPRLWWPNGYGRQDLYRLKLTLYEDSTVVSDIRYTKFGVRELSYDFTVDYQKVRRDVRVNLDPLKVWPHTEKIIAYRMHGYESRRLPNSVQIGFVSNLKDTLLLDKGTTPSAAPYLVIRVNGMPIYCRGGNWGIDEAMKRITREKMEPYFRLHKDAGFTMIRNWTGQSTEDLFYDLADEYGMLVWNDFWMSTENYNLDPWDNQLFMNNARDAVRHYRNHPSIAVWCGRNEGNPPMSLDDSLYILQAREDGTRIYHPSSIKNNLATSGPWFYENFARKEIISKEGFNTETGAPAVPVAETMKKMMAPEDLWPIGDAWYYHDFHGGQKEYIKAIEDQYGTCNGIDEFCLKAQMLNYEVYREIFESWNYRLWNPCSGLLLWMSHPAWPSTFWQTYSSDYETNGGYYGSKKACEPLHIQLRPESNEVWFINNTARNYTGLRTEIKICNLSSELIASESCTFNSNANNPVKCCEVKIQASFPPVYMVRMQTFSSSGRLLSENTYFRSSGGNKDFKSLSSLAKVSIKGKATSGKQTGALVRFTVKVSNPEKTMAVGIKLGIRDPATNKRILPAYISDGYFTLLPGESRTINADCPADWINSPVSFTAEGLNVLPQEIERKK